MKNMQHKLALSAAIILSGPPALGSDERKEVEQIFIQYLPSKTALHNLFLNDTYANPIPEMEIDFETKTFRQIFLDDSMRTINEGKIILPPVNQKKSG